MSKPTQALVKQLEARVEQLAQANQKLKDTLNRTNLLHEVSVLLSTALDFETIVTKAVSFAKYLDATSGEIHLQTDTGEVYLKSSYPERNNLNDLQRQELVRRILADGLDAWVVQTGQLALVLDTQHDDRWLPVEHPDQIITARSAICAPLKIGQGRLKGAISFVHSEPNHFDKQDLTLLGTLTTHISTALENAYKIKDIEDSLYEAHLMLDISRYFSGASTVRAIHRSVVQSITVLGAEHCAIFTCHGLSSNNLPTGAKITFIGDPKAPKAKNKLLNYQFSLNEYPALMELVTTQDTLVTENIEKDERLSEADKTLFNKLGLHSLVINPLITRIHVVGILTIAYKSKHIFTERELALYRTLCNQTTQALEHVKQIRRTENALAETQTLYRAGRVLAGAEGFHQILEEALVEFVYSLGLDQGGIVLLTSDKQFGRLMAYLQDGEVQPVSRLRFRVDESIPYQQVLLSGQPFASSDLSTDAQVAEFSDFNQQDPVKSILQAPMIMHGETIGWIGADVVKEHREFSQREIDMARAMADQIAIAIQNRQLLEQTERRADQLRAVATVGEAVTGLTDLSEVLKLTVNLIRDRFGFYHVSIFLIDNAREWAVVKASTGEVGKIMVERPHRLGVGSNSIVGYATRHAKPRIALDVGKDAVHFNNPLLPDTRSEMALPLTSRGYTIGALDVQSVEANAFTNEDVETLQIMADQITTAIETARLFEETQRRLHEQAMLYRIGTKIGGSLNLQDTTDILVSETAQMLDVAECVLTLQEDNNTAFCISDYVREGSDFSNDTGERFKIDEFPSWPKVLATKQEIIIYANDKNISGWEADYLREHGGTAFILVPILLRNKVIGMLEIYDDHPTRTFSENDIVLLDSVALLAANAIENARLLESARESQTFMKAVINQIPDPIFIKDRQHRWVVINTAFSHYILGQPEENVLGRSDYDFLPKAEADHFWEQDDKMFETGQPQEVEEPITDSKGNARTLFTRKIPLTLTEGEDSPEYLVGIIQDITERKQREVERERLLNEVQDTLERTQALYRVSDALATATDQKSTFEQVLREYLKLLKLSQGSVMLHNKTTACNIAHARFIANKPAEPKLILRTADDLVFQHLLKVPKPLVIDNPQDHSLTKEHQGTRGQQDATAMLFIPLMARDTLTGTLVIDATGPEYTFNNSDIEIGQVIADQLAIWLENRSLLQEVQHRSDSLGTAAKVSRAASSILNIDELIETSVNFIRDQFEFYYVGLFMLDNEEKWAVLKAGTGEAGKIQLANNHKLEIGGESMIGWSVKNRRARIALDVGEEAVHFRNPNLPDTRSEMALPLISRDKVMGALTIQSTKRLAFSDEDITLLQTMADQLANAIANANLFTQTQEALAEAEALYQVSQAISLARDEKVVYQLAIDAIARSKVSSAAIYIYGGSQQTGRELTPFVEQKVAWSANGPPSVPNGTRMKAADFAIEQLVPHHGSFLIEDMENDPRLTDSLRQALSLMGIEALLVIPLSTHHTRIGFLLITHKDKEQEFTKNQLRYFNTISQQMVVALENLHLLDNSQKRARREEIIREITSKIRNATDINDIMKTTVTELGKVIGTSRGKIMLGVPAQETTPIGIKQNGDTPINDVAVEGEEN